MPAPTVAQKPIDMQARRFVPAHPDTFAAGREMYRSGKSLSQCTPAQAEGWRFEEARCEDAYWACMMQQAAA